MKKLISILTFCMFMLPLYMDAGSPYSNISEENLRGYSAATSHDGCSESQVKKIYTVTEVKDTVLMDLLCDEVCRVWHNDSIYNLIKTEYYPYLKNDWLNVNIGFSTRDSIQWQEDDTINDKLIPEGYDRKQICETPVLEICMIFYYYPFQTPWGAFYTNYKGQDYYFENTLVVKPTNKKKVIIKDDDPKIWYHLWDYAIIYLIYLDGKIYLDPYHTKWERAFE